MKNTKRQNTAEMLICIFPNLIFINSETLASNSFKELKEAAIEAQNTRIGSTLRPKGKGYELTFN